MGDCDDEPVTLDPATLDRLWDFSDPASSEARFREAGSDPELQTQLARALGLQGRFDEAREILNAITDAAPAVQTRVALERGRLANSSGDPVAAVPLFELAERLASAAHLEFLEIDAIHMLAIADGERASGHAARGLQRVESAEHARSKRWAVGLHNNLGWTLFDSGDAAGALVEFGEALAAAVAWGTPDQEFFSRWAIARAYREVGRLSDALELQETLLDERPGDADVLEELAILRAQ